ncbi:hypothetical protein BCV69DRAFT_110131 [Microstroma glucosiphilum]|uniref:Autophagy-related protein 101 n=1 Tax=Pseudomicrostroma glucosiphilum TaxID=1684307 RepID=A0A316UE11_9BASI|nr:hypothetical protein BCV69DRAFT_110131 [Pseudomicrostroma glucosiphilum]PWN23138.1 hypothetical protein BCV69DRAFT_110131 [Pseudomicrostroma glucosiphilum]
MTSGGMPPSAPTTFHLPSPIRTSTASQLRQAVILVLHSILFHRVYGTLKPASVLYLTTEFPVVPEKGVVQVVRSKADEMVKRVLSGAAASSTELVVSLYDPAALSTGPAGPSQQRTEAGGAYRYGWLAQAFASGIGGPSVEHPSGAPHSEASTSLPIVPDLGSFKSAEEHGEPFETWRISFQLIKTRRRSSVRAGGGVELDPAGNVDADAQVEEQLVEFLEQMLRFVDEQRDHVPALPSSELCPFPIVIDVGHK